ncbi:TolC family protein [Yeosuana marina]|uniref:TolC family protein n=1 Tax=Yeosuana marina TaxID=1565536 RepID=UPI0014210316|nr:TolC family protein [Yeosuana marina]
MINRNYWILGLIWVFANSMFAQEISNKSTLKQLINSALENNYLLQANEKNVFIKQAEIEILKTNYQPKISTSLNFSYWKFLLPNKQKLLGDNGLSDMYTDISIYQTIYDWGENKLKKSVVEDEIKLNDDIKRQIRNTIIWGVYDAYFEAQKIESEIAALQNASKQLKSHLQYANNLYKIGRVSNIDVLKINLQIAVVEKDLKKAQNQYLSQEIKIKSLCHLDDNKSLEMENTSEIHYNNSKNILFPQDFLYTEVIQNHPVLLAANKKITMESKQKDIYSLQNRPEFFSYGIGSWEHAYIPFGDNFNYNIGLGISYTLPFWGGSSYKSNVLKSNMRVEQLNDEKNQLFIDIKKEIDLELNAIIDIKEEIANNEKIIELANETLNNALIKYQAGLGPVIDVLDAQTIVTETTIAHQKSIIAFLQSVGNLNYLIGNDNYPF